MIKKVIDTYQNEGMRAVARKISDKIRGRSGVVNNVNSINSKIDLSKSPQMPQIEDIVSQSVYEKPDKIAKTKLKITFITPPVGPGGGGHSTIARFANFLQNNGHQVSFAIYNTNTISQTAKEAQDVFKKSYGLSTVVKLASELANEDVVFATSWETAYGVLNLKTKAHKFYFVQDFEPMFFGVGSRYMLAEATYKFGFYGITAGKWLTKKVAQYGMLADYFDFGVDLDTYKPKPSQVIKKQKKIIFYARAHTERRGFELGVLALQIFKEKYPEYEIAFFGQDTSGYEIPFEYTNLGILTKNDLSKLYQESVACLVLSLTNVSLLPLELLASGCVPVMNGGENNTLVLGDINGIEYTTAYPTSLAGKLCSVVERDDIEVHSVAISESVEGKSWQKSYEKVEKIILQEVTING